MQVSVEQELNPAGAGGREKLLGIAQAVKPAVRFSRAAPRPIVEREQLAAALEGGIGQDRAEFLELVSANHAG